MRLKNLKNLPGSRAGNDSTNGFNDPARRMCVANCDIRLFANSKRTRGKGPDQEQPESRRYVLRVWAFIENSHRHTEASTMHLKGPLVFALRYQLQVRQCLGLAQNRQVHLQCFYQQTKLRWSCIQTLQRIGPDVATFKAPSMGVQPVDLPERVFFHPYVTVCNARAWTQPRAAAHLLHQETKLLQHRRRWGCKRTIMCRLFVYSDGLALTFQWPDP